jgi:hypothetical protein
MTATTHYDQRITFRLKAREKARLIEQAQREGGTSTALLRAIVIAYLDWKERQSLQPRLPFHPFS